MIRAVSNQLEPPLPAPGRARRPDPTFRALVRTLGLLKRVGETHFSQFGISGAQWGVLITLHRAEQEENHPAMRLTDLGDRLLVRPPSVTGVVDRLGRLGLIKRQPSTEDARSKLVSLTSGGREMVRRISQSMPAYIEAILGDLPSHDRDELRRLLEAVAVRLEDLSDTPKAQEDTPDLKTSEL